MNYIRLRKNNLCVEKVLAKNLVKKFKTPFYCYSLSQLKNNFNVFSNAFKATKPLVCFALKANSNITLLRELKKMGSGADVVSVGELLKAMKAGINAKKIVFSGVGKTEDEIKTAIKKRILLINIESENEADLINNISRKMSKITSVGIRLNPNITGKTHRKISTGGRHDKFGLNYKDCINLCKKINNFKNLKLEGLSVHIGSQITDVRPFKQVLSAINKIMSKTATHTWRIADFNFDKEEYTMDDTATVTIRDLDGLRYPFDKRTGYQMHIWSDTDKGGVEVNAYWKPNFRGTPQMHGDYPVKVTFIDPDRRESTVRELYYKSGGSEVELKVSPGDNIYAEYYDRTLPKPYSTEDKLKLNAIATITEGSQTGVIVVNPAVTENDDLHAKQFAFTKYTSGGEYLVSVWWDSWEWWTNQPTANSDNAINISIVDGMTEKPVSDISYNLNVSTDGTSVVEKQHDYTRTDVIDFSIENNGLIEVLLSDLGEATEPLKFKFMVDSELQPNAPFTQISE